MTLDHPTVATVAKTCDSNPEQYEGTLTDGRWFYFRYRWGRADLGIGEDLDTAVHASLDHARRVGESGFEGEFTDAGQCSAVFAQMMAEAAEMGA